MAPIHHHFEMKGWEEPKVVVRLWIIAILLALSESEYLKASMRLDAENGSQLCSRVEKILNVSRATPAVLSRLRPRWMTVFERSR